MKLSVQLKSAKDLEKITFGHASGLSATFLKNNGSLFAITYGDYFIGLSQANPLEGNVPNLYLRVFEGKKIAYTPLTGPTSPSTAQAGSNGIQWMGEFKGISYICSFLFAGEMNAWFWKVTLDGEGQADLVYFQNKAIAARGVARNNEYYTSHYIDNHVFETDNGFVIAARQNMKQATGFPYLIEGSFNNLEGFLTDGLQFYGVDYKETNIPAALMSDSFPNIKLQDEYCASGFKSEKVTLSTGNAHEVIFFAIFHENHPEATSERDLEYVTQAKSIYESLPGFSPTEDLHTNFTVFNSAPLFPSEDLSDADISDYFGSELRHKEEQDRKLLAFFAGKKHVVLKAKEVRCERPHGHIIRSGKSLYPSDDVICSTNYMYGCFHAQIAIGNTSFNQMLSYPRTLLNIQKCNGQRIFVTLNGKKYLLGLPSAYEIGFSSTRWIYKGADATITVTVWAEPEDTVIRTSIESDVEATFLIVNEISLGPGEYDQGGELEREDETVFLLPAKGSMIFNQYPNAKFFVTAMPEATESMGGAELLGEHTIQNLPVVAIQTKPTKSFGLAMGGSIHDGEKAEHLAKQYANPNAKDLENDVKELEAYFHSVLQDMNIYHEKDLNEEVSKLNDLMYWYLHNGVVHFSIPHGLEQCKGAAWGVRDVLQGSVEFLLACGQGEVVREILKTVMSHQFFENGDWPQWFMFDAYKEIQDDHSHGDIIIWPLKAVSEYIEYTNDFSILNEEVPYTLRDSQGKEFTKETYTILEHLQRAVGTIIESFVGGTNLPCYGGGDWNDSLQPANQDIKQRMVSAWTSAIAYQYMNMFANVCEMHGETDYAHQVRDIIARLKADFDKHVMKDGQVSGFIYVDKDGSIENVIHKSDTRTGIHYRLLPMTRGILAEIFTKKQAEDHKKLIWSYLRSPDGVRLMEKHASYQGGVSTTFLRRRTGGLCRTRNWLAIRSRAPSLYGSDAQDW